MVDLGHYDEADIIKLEAGWRRMLVLWCVIAWMFGGATVIALRMAGGLP